jgi:hypothetical protein
MNGGCARRSTPGFVFYMGIFWRKLTPMLQQVWGP